jgi:hypothetical protein
MRTTRSTATFFKPFKLDGIDETMPPGTYIISTTEEELNTVLSQGWLRVSTLFCQPSIESAQGSEQWTSISASNLIAALERDSLNTAEPAQPSQDTSGTNISFQNREP